MQKHNIDALIAELHAYIQESEDGLDALKEDGTLKSMNQRVSILCQQIAQLDREQAKAYEAPLQQALEGVERLQQKLQDQQKKTMDALGNVKQHSAAVSAYAKNLK